MALLWRVASRYTFAELSNSNRLAADAARSKK
jgi:hypothetical protein